MPFRVKWKNGEVVLLEGVDIAEAFNSVGYTENDIAAIDNFYEYDAPSKDHVDYPLADFCCKSCQGTVQLTAQDRAISKAKVYACVCSECGHVSPGSFDPMKAKVIHNLYCVNGTIPTKQELKDALQLLQSNYADALSYM